MESVVNSVKEKEYFLGIDGGATKTEFVLFSGDGTVQKVLRLPSSNPNDVGIDGCVDVITNGIQSCLLQCPHLNKVYAGISGVSVGNHKQNVTLAIKQNFPQIEFFVESDIVNVFACQKDCSVALICGTGSVAFIKNGDKIERVGGWGYLFDESGSAYDLGKDAIRVALATSDGLCEKSRVSELVTEKLGADVFFSLGDIYKKGKTFIASLATAVTIAYQEGDKTAEQILHKNMKRLAFIANSATKRANNDKVIVGGGLIENCKDILIPILNEYTDVKFMFSEFPPVYGACVYCAEKFGVKTDNEFYKNFKSSYGDKNA